MKYLKLFEEVELDLSDYEEDWEETPENYDDIIDQMKNHVTKHNIMAIKVTKENWKDFAEMCLENDIIWASKRPVEINDKNIEDRNSIIVTVHPFKTNKNKLKIKYVATINKYKDAYKKSEIHIFNDKKIELYPPIPKKINEQFENKDIDPFDEENWDEVEKELSLCIIKIKLQDNIGDTFLIVNINDNKDAYMAYLDLEYNEFDYDDKHILKEKNIVPINDIDIKWIKNDKIFIYTFYKPINSNEIDIRNYTYSELNHITKIMDKVKFMGKTGFLKENFDFKDEDFDEEEFEDKLRVGEKMFIKPRIGEIIRVIDNGDFFDIDAFVARIIKIKEPHKVVVFKPHENTKIDVVWDIDMGWIVDKQEYNESFDFNDDDFDFEEFDPNVDNDLVDAMLQITIEDFSDGFLDAYYELLRFVDEGIELNFLMDWDWKISRGLSINDEIVQLTKHIINNGRSIELKKFFRKIVKNHRKYAIGYLPEELWKNFK